MTKEESIEIGKRVSQNFYNEIACMSPGKHDEVILENMIASAVFSAANREEQLENELGDALELVKVLEIDRRILYKEVLARRNLRKDEISKTGRTWGNSWEPLTKILTEASQISNDSGAFERARNALRASGGDGGGN